ncbi:NAD(P)/FAD-dependent oxidoreductase [Lactococcus termiticola]|uniref:FAD-dependent protein C-terminal domain-containing protein n=1 Tax=Lactococcus termiticola TaxID=2169526 RepID=A0A2R5HHS5_9LACT|nr:NAD(P)/FAD-dependent oxidoreductase [Lactococcus termiticola]GBG96915.1 hypothetical protein NtB2_01050 [Lactococcus termiticola]
MIRLSQLKLTIDEPTTKLPEMVAKRLKVPVSDLSDFRIYKESIDARNRDGQGIIFNYTVDVNVPHEASLLKKKLKNVQKTPDFRYKLPVPGQVQMKHRPIVVGFGPAGMFAALLLAQMGYKPIVLERGQQVADRVKAIDNFWKNGELNPASNVQFGEGGAGTFSDGKLTSRVRDLRSRKVLSEFVAAGAPEDILYKSHPHVGTDLLRDIVVSIREEIIRLGGEVHFEAQVADFDIVEDERDNLQLKGLTLTDGRHFEAEQMVLAIGHSARDTFRKIYARGIQMEAKPFAVGVRIEHPQSLINEAQYKDFAQHPRLGAAEYHLTHKASSGRGVYSFCMCPGGTVVPAASELGHLVTNGMSEHARDAENANSGLIVQVFPEDFKGGEVLSGIDFQEELEKKAFELGGGTYQAPAQLLGDYLAHRPSEAIGEVQPSYALGVKLTELHELFPDFINQALEEALPAFGQKIKGFDRKDAVMTGVESRSSSPVRILRDKESHQSINIAGLYPSGEGAGFAGGIVSAAIDGLKCAEKMIEDFAPFE